MWYKTQNGSSEKPSELDTTSSKKFNYIRKDFELVETVKMDPVDGDSTQEIPEHWEWMEAKIEKDDWETFLQVMGHDDALNDVYAALAELAEMVVW